MTLKKTKIDWCDCTLNPVVGCKRNCEYCYARKLNDRFHFVNDWTNPEIFPERLKMLASKKPKSIFMNSMSDYCWWNDWMSELVGEAIDKNPQHQYIFLTKGNKAFDDHDDNPNIWNGKTITTQETADSSDNKRFNFLSIEPILEPIRFSIYLIKNVELFIIGAETGNRKGKVIPKKEWIDSLVKQADDNKISVFMKESLREIMGDEFRQDKLPWQKTVGSRAICMESNGFIK